MKLKIESYYHCDDQPKDITELVLWLEDISKRQIHGHRDNDRWSCDGELLEDKSQLRIEKLLAGYGELQCHCRYISLTINKLFENLSIKSRLVELVSARHGEPTLNRHCCSEIFFDNQWIHVDADMGVMFRGDWSEYLHSLKLKERLDLALINAVDVYRLTNDKKISLDFPKIAIADMYHALKDDNAMIGWYRSKANALMFGTDIFIPDSSPEYMDSVRKNMVTSKKGKENFMSETEFRKKYYSD